MPMRRPPAHAAYAPATGGASTPAAEPLARPTRTDLTGTPPVVRAESPLPLDGATIALSLPIAIALGQLNVPAAAGWAAVLILYTAATAPGVARGTLDSIVDGFNLDGDIRARLGVPPRAARQRPVAAWQAPVVAVQGWKAAIAARRGAGAANLEAGALPPPPPDLPAGRGGQARTGTTTPLTALASLLDEAEPEAAARPMPDAPLSLEAALAQLPSVLPLRALALDPRPLAVPLGMTPEGELRWVDLAEDVVNIGVYGTTGAGKDLLLLQWFVLLCRRNDPTAIQFIVLDGKGDWLLPQLKGLTHMRVDPAGGYGNLQAVKDALHTIHQEARAREQRIFGSGHRSREHYMAATGQPLPLLVVIVTDLMTTVQGFVEEELAELISKARALGIRVVMSFQNPTGKDMAWRANIGLVLAGCMVDGSQDAVVLGIRKLQDMRYRPSQLPNPKKSDSRTKGLFVVRHGSEQLLVKTSYLDDDALLRLCGRLPRRVAAPAPPRAATPADPPVPPPGAEAPAPAEDALLAALLRQAAPVTDTQVQAQRHRRWPSGRPQERLSGRRSGVGAARPRRGPAEAAEGVLEATAQGDARGGLPPISATTEGVSEDERLYRMMRIPLGFNQIYRAVGSDRTELSRRCQRIRQERGMGPWPRTQAKLDRATLVRQMSEVPMGFNESHRALGGGRTDLSTLWQEVTGQADTERAALDTVRTPV